MAWRPVVKRQAFPREGPHMRWAPVQQALVTALAPMLTDNFGRVTVQSQCRVHVEARRPGLALDRLPGIHWLAPNLPCAAGTSCTTCWCPCSACSSCSG